MTSIRWGCKQESDCQTSPTLCCAILRISHGTYDIIYLHTAIWKRIIKRFSFFNMLTCLFGRRGGFLSTASQTFGCANCETGNTIDWPPSGWGRGRISESHLPWRWRPAGYLRGRTVGPQGGPAVHNATRCGARHFQCYSTLSETRDNAKKRFHIGADTSVWHGVTMSPGHINIFPF